MALTLTGYSTSLNSPGFGSTFQYSGTGELTRLTSTHHTPAGDVTWVWENTPATTAGGSTQTSVVTGIDPNEISNALYGKIIPLSALGLARIGTAGLMFGPYLNSGAASFAVSFGFPANPAGERRVYEIALDGKVAWENSAGNPAGALGAGFTADAFECRFYSGTMTQGADPLEAGRFGAEAIAYRPQMMLWFSNLPLAPYNGKVPFVSAKIGDVTAGAVPGDGINLGEALERIAYSPWLEYDASSFETNGVADIVQGMILTEDQSFLDLLQITNRVYRTLDLLQTDKLRINDRGSLVTPDLALHRDHILADGGVGYARQEPSGVARELELLTIDPDADYVFMPSKAVRPLEPVSVTASTRKDSVTLPVVIDANTRMSLVTYDKYEEDNARKRISLQTMLYGYALEPGDLFRVIGVADGFDNSEVFKVMETSHGANYINEISAEAILKCAIDIEDDFNDVLLLLHANSGTPIIDNSNYNESFYLLRGASIDTVNTKFGAGSFLFDGVDDVVETSFSIGHTALQYNFSPTNTSPYTIELWARPTRLGHSSNQMLICRHEAYVVFVLWALYITPLNEIRYITYANATVETARTTSVGAGLTLNAWHHIALDKDSTGTIRIYVNGVMKAHDTPLNSVIAHSVAVQLSVGCSGAVSIQDQFQGNIDDVRITARSRYGDLYGNTSFAPPAMQFPDAV